MKGKLKRIMALALGVVTCFMSIAPNVAYAAEDCSIDLDAALNHNVNARLDSVYEALNNDGVEITEVEECSGGSYEDTSVGTWQAGNINKDTGELEIGTLRQELLRGSEVHLGDDTQSAKISIGQEMPYNGWSTHLFTCDDGTVLFCVQPKATTPANGTYTATRIHPTDDYRKWMIAALYFGYSGPGYMDANYGLYKATYNEDSSLN